MSSTGADGIRVRKVENGTWAEGRRIVSSHRGLKQERNLFMSSLMET